MIRMTPRLWLCDFLQLAGLGAVNTVKFGATSHSEILENSQ